MFCLLSLIPLAATACGASDAPSAGYFDGKTITIMLPFSPGGGTDTATRFIVQRAVDELEGDVDVEFKNDESAGGIGGPNNWTLEDRKDGTYLLAATTTTVMPWLFGEDGVRYDFRQMTPLWGHPAGRMAYVNPDTGVKTAADLQNSTKPLVSAARTGAGAEITSLLAFDVLGLTDDVNVVMGYEGGSEQVIAYEQGEINFNHQPTATYARDNGNWEKEGKANVLFTHGLLEEGKWVPDPIMPDVPTVHDVYVKMHNEEPTGEAWDAFSAITTLVNHANYSLWVNSEVPAEATTELQDAFAAAIAQPDYEKEAGELIGPYKSLAGKDAEAFGKELAEYDLEKTPWIVFTKEFLRDNYGFDVGQ